MYPGDEPPMELFSPEFNYLIEFAFTVAIIAFIIWGFIRWIKEK